MAIGVFRCIVMNVTDLERGEHFWSAVTGLPIRFSGVGYPTRYSRLGDIASHSILLQLVAEGKPPPTNNAHLDLTVKDVDTAVEQALALGARVFRQKDTYPLGSSQPYLEWAVMTDPFGNRFCLIRDLEPTSQTVESPAGTRGESRAAVRGRRST
jgi:predicted enzyme related to lactoylglutathione lyase